MLHSWIGRVFFRGLVGFAIAGLPVWMFKEQYARWVSRIDLMFQRWEWLFAGEVLVGCGIAGFLLVHLGVFRLNRVDLQIVGRFIAYPSVWVAGFAGTVPLWWVLEFDFIDWLVSYLASGLLMVGLGIVWLLLNPISKKEWLNKHKKQSLVKSSNSDSKSLCELVKDQEALINWIGNDYPMFSEEEDRTGANNIARHITERLITYTSCDPMPTFALVGSFGSGKTSILRLVDRMLHGLDARWKSRNKAKGRFWTCWVDGWGVRSPQSAEQYILEKVLREISEHVECVGLMGLPHMYIEAMNASSNGWAGIAAALLHHRKDPVIVLEEINATLTAVDVHLVIFLEDMDRNNKNEGTLAGIQSLLDRLHHRADRICFIVALDLEAATKIDLLKTCDYVNYVELLDAELIWRLIHTFGKHCFKSASYIQDKHAKKIEDHLWHLYTHDFFGGELGLARYFEGEGQADPRLAVARILQTPRALKQCLRETLNAWGKLHGEVDFDDLLVIKALKNAESQAFNFIVLWINELQGLEHLNEESKKRVLEVWNEHAKDMLQWKREACEILIMYLFGDWQTKGSNDDKLVRYLSKGERRVQGIRNDNASDYWLRITNNEVRDLPDQEVLKATAEWKDNNENQPLVERMVLDSAFAEKFEVIQTQYGWNKIYKYSAREIRQLASQVFDLMLKLDGVRACACVRNELFIAKELIGYMVCLGIAKNNTYFGHGKWIWGEIKKAFRISLRFALDHEDNFAEQFPGVSNLQLLERRIRLAIRLFAQKEFNDHPERLARVLDLSNIWTLKHLITHGEGTDEVFGSANWAWMGPVILKAVGHDPLTMIPHIAGLVAKRVQAKKPSESTYAWDDDVFQAVFENDSLRQQVYQLLARVDGDVLQLQPDDSEMLRIIHQEAIKRLT